MQNVGIYHIAAQQYCVHSLTRQQCSQGLCPWTPLGDSPQTPTFSRYALGLISADFQNNVPCKAIYLLRVY